MGVSHRPGFGILEHPTSICDTGVNPNIKLFGAKFPADMTQQSSFKDYCLIHALLSCQNMRTGEISSLLFWFFTGFSACVSLSLNNSME